MARRFSPQFLYSPPVRRALISSHLFTLTPRGTLSMLRPCCSVLSEMLLPPAAPLSFKAHLRTFSTFLTPESCRRQLDALNRDLSVPWQWQQDDRRETLAKSYVFDDFLTALRFMLRVAPHAERLGHHPEWTNIYHTVHVVLTTHDCQDRLSPKDFDLAQCMDQEYLQIIQQHQDSKQK
jgi:4a-hydroxytetrahydrobiopterin dehydratase